MNDCFAIINIIQEINRAIRNGDEITYEPLFRRLRWKWLNTRTGQCWYIRAVQLKQINDSDLRKDIIWNFVMRKINATEAASRINKLTKLKAFW